MSPDEMRESNERKSFLIFTQGRQGLGKEFHSVPTIQGEVITKFSSQARTMLTGNQCIAKY